MLLPHGTYDAVRSCWRALQKERLHLEEILLSEGLIYTKLLFHRRTSELFPEWLDLLKTFDLFALDNPHLTAAVNEEFQSGGEEMPHVTGVIFDLQMMGINTVESFRSLMLRLDRDTADFRERCLSGFRPGRFDISALVLQGWLGESRVPDFDWNRAAADYAACADIAMGWGNQPLAVRCVIAQAICIDENGDDSERALNCLTEGEKKYGFDIALARARAKIHWRRRDHEKALPLLAAAAEAGGQEPLERAFIAREAAISSAHLGDWRAADAWFYRAQTAAALVPMPSIRAMAIGLIADSGYAAARAGDLPRALEKFREAALALPTIDPDGTLEEAYCHRIVRHGTLWFSFMVSGKALKRPDGQEIIFEAGGGSNPEPLEAIRTHPIGDLDYCFYLLADADRAFPEPTGYSDRFRDDLVGGPILSSEVSIVIARANDLIRLHKTTDFVQLLKQTTWITGFRREPERLGANVLHPVRGHVPLADVDEGLNDDMLIGAEDFLLTFMIVSVVTGNFEAFDGAMAACVATSELKALRSLLESLNGNAQGVTREKDVLALSVNRLRRTAVSDPKETLWHGIFLLLHARTTWWGSVLQAPVIAWIFDCWDNVIRHRRFALVTPALTAPAIEAIISDPDRSLAAASRLTLAGIPASGAVVQAPVLSILTDLAASQ